MSHNAITVNNFEPSETGALSIGSGRQMIAIGRGSAVNYSASPASALTVDSTLYLYDASPINSVSGASITATGSWIESITLPAGSYSLMGYFSVLFSATGSFEFGWWDGSAIVGNGAVVGATATSTLDGARIAMAGLTLTATTTFTLRVIAATNVSTIASQGTVPAAESWMLVERI